MVIDYIIFIVNFPQCDQNDLNERDELSADQPDVHQANIGGGWQLLHHTLKHFISIVNLSDLPDEEGSKHQQTSEVHCESSLKVERFKVCCCV